MCSKEEKKVVVACFKNLYRRVSDRKHVKRMLYPGLWLMISTVENIWHVKVVKYFVIDRFDYFKIFTNARKGLIWIYLPFKICFIFLCSSCFTNWSYPMQWRLYSQMTQLYANHITLWLWECIFVGVTEETHFRSTTPRYFNFWFKSFPNVWEFVARTPFALLPVCVTLFSF